MPRKVIAIGLDGLEPTIVETMLGRGELPNLAELRARGSYSRLRTTYPAQTPVAWSSFVTGANPGAHGIFDFIGRNPATYQPDSALSRFERPKSVLAAPRVVNQRRGTPIWHVLTAAGVPSTVLRCPCTFPTETLTGKMLAGVGVPDLRGSQSKGTFYTQDRTVAALESEQVIFLDKEFEIRTRVLGPRNTRQSPPSDTYCEIKLRVDTSSRTLMIDTGGTPPNVAVEEGSWSEWVRLKFKFSLLQSVTGIARFYVRSLKPHLEFYLSAVNFDPAAPMFPISSPADYSRQLADQIGLFSTLGMAEEHNGLNNGRFDEAAYLRHCELVLEERERMLHHELNRFQEGFFFTVFDTPDRLQHMMWRFRDPDHPLYHADLHPELALKIEEHYQRCDQILRTVLDRVDENTLLIVLSDHGFGGFYRAFDTNTWLQQNGLLKLKEGRRPSAHLVEGYKEIDWSQTYAYAVGLGGIYLNLKGREAAGRVEEGGEAQRVRDAIQTGLAGIGDATTGKAAVRNVSRREEIYSGPYVHEAPDLLVNFHQGFRVSWESAIGGFADAMIQNNTRRWSGDHIVDPDAVPGILFMSQDMGRSSPRIIDLAPTILDYLQVPASESIEGTSLLTKPK